MSNSLNKFLIKLKDESIVLENNVRQLNKSISSENIKLNEKEQKINAIHIFRSVGYADSSASFYNFKSHNEIKEIETELTESIKYLTSSCMEFESFIVDDFKDNELDSYFMKCEQEYILWFSRIWHYSGCHMNHKTKYILIENDSGKSFDLNSMKWIKDAFENQNIMESFYSERSVFNESEARKRISLSYDY